MYRAFCGRPAFRVLARVPAFSYSVPYVCGSSRRMGSTSTTAGMEPRPVFFFDIDNCLYSKSHNVHAEMEKLINSFFVRHLALDPEDAHMLHQKYYKEYGLALEGLTRHHKVDPLEFNYEVDDALPMDKILKPDPKLRALIEDIDQSKVKLWLLTNAYVNHAKRVVKLLHIDDLFEGVTFCDYSQYPLICKPNQEMYKRAEADAGAPGPDQCYFVDDSHLNCKHAEARGWTTVHFVESGQPIPRIPACKYMVHRLEDLRVHFPHLFKSTSGQTSG